MYAGIFQKNPILGLKGIRNLYLSADFMAAAWRQCERPVTKSFLDNSCAEAEPVSFSSLNGRQGDGEKIWFNGELKGNMIEAIGHLQRKQKNGRSARDHRILGET